MKTHRMSAHLPVLLAVCCSLLIIGCATQGNTTGEDGTDRRRSSPNIIYADEIQQRQPSSLSELLVGRVPGVYTEAGELRIRGTRSFTGSNEPLYVVDDIITTSLPSMSMNDIASVEVIKGGEAAAYGVRGANGVIIIKSKRSVTDGQ